MTVLNLQMLQQVLLLSDVSLEAVEKPVYSIDILLDFNQIGSLIWIFCWENKKPLRFSKIKTKNLCYPTSQKHDEPYLLLAALRVSWQVKSCRWCASSPLPAHSDSLCWKAIYNTEEWLILAQNFSQNPHVGVSFHTHVSLIYSPVILLMYYVVYQWMLYLTQFMKYDILRPWGK